jgi:hypothetical protein
MYSLQDDPYKMGTHKWLKCPSTERPKLLGACQNIKIWDNLWR